MVIFCIKTTLIRDGFFYNLILPGKLVRIKFIIKKCSIFVVFIFQISNIALHIFLIRVNIRDIFIPSDVYLVGHVNC